MEPADASPGAAMRAFLKAVHAFRTYPQQNEITRKALYDLVPLLTAAAPFRVEVGPRGFKDGDAALLDGGADKAQIVASLHRDGVRIVEFGAGIEADEIERMVTALAERLHPDDLSEDYVTRLWEADLKHVRVAAVDPYLDTEMPEDVLEGTARPEAGEDEKPPEAKNEPPPPPEEAFRITEREAMRIAREVAASQRNPPWVRFIEVLVETLMSPTGLRRTDELVTLVETTFQRLLDEGRIGDAARLLRRLRDSVPAAAMGPLLPAVARMAGTERLAAVHVAMESGDDFRGEAETIFTLLSPASVPSILHFAGRAASGRTRDLYGDLLVKIGEPAAEPVMEGLQREEPDELRVVFARVLARLGHPEAVRVLQQEIRRADPRLRREFVRALALAGEREEATRVLLEVALRDRDATCRTLALRSLGTAAVGLGADRLLERLRSREAAVEGEERDLLFVALGRVGGEEIIPVLAGYLKHQWLPGRWNGEDARRAAFALARMGHPRAHQLLEEISERGRGRVAQICTRAILDNRAGAR